MANNSFLAKFPNGHARFLPFLKSDHTPIVVTLDDNQAQKPRPFRFHNFLVNQSDFIPLVQRIWDTPVTGIPMFSVVTKLKRMKRPLRKLNHTTGNLFEKVKFLRTELQRVQEAVVQNPNNPDIRTEEAAYVKAYNNALKDEECFLKQRAKIDWLKEGDQNTKYFHHAINGRKNRTRIHHVQDSQGRAFTGSQVTNAFIDHFKNILGVKANVIPIPDPQSLFSSTIPAQAIPSLIAEITDEEIKVAMFDTDDYKAPGPDGFSAKFYKATWHIVGPEVTKAIKQFFENGQLLKEVNATTLALVPKISTPAKTSDYRPIACCNVLYKCISKIIVNRLKCYLEDIIDDCQSAFVPGRQISDNILITQGLMRNYHRMRGEARCAFKIDIQKAYDTVDWDFMESCLNYFGFPPKMIGWIMTCVKTPCYSISINGTQDGYFKGKRGLRQGDPLSPYLFTMVMQVLTLMIKRFVAHDDSFQYHWKCEEVQLTHLCFADDLFLFCHGDQNSVSTLMTALDCFKEVSGLTPSLPKSTIYFGNVNPAIREIIEQNIQFQVGTLPVKYLGVPLISTRLYHKDCAPLIDKAKVKICDWKNKSLSFAGRLQLIHSVLNSLQVYWSSVFILPASTTKEIEKLMRNFLWNQGEFKQGKAKVKWSTVCLPMRHGGLGIKSLKMWNLALMTKHIWNLITHKNSVWVKWIRSFRLQNTHFWAIHSKWDVCWAWRKLLEARPLIQPHIKHQIGNGQNTSLWFDNWHCAGPLYKLITHRQMCLHGFSPTSKVHECTSNGEWMWPREWFLMYPALYASPPPILDPAKIDEVVWITNEGTPTDFSVNTAWKDLRMASMEVNWHKVIWFSQNIPRHAFIIWLAYLGKLQTHSNIKKWNPSFDAKCVLCNSVMDSHNHLFFTCPYSSTVWNKVRFFTTIGNNALDWNGLKSHMANLSLTNSIWSVINRLVLAASVYYIWQERNWRTHQKKTRPPNDLANIILNMVRTRLLGLQIKTTRNSRAAAVKWRLNIGDTSNLLSCN